MAYVGREVVQKKSQYVEMGDSMTGFMKKLGMSVSGGKRGTIGPFKQQINSLFSCMISCSYLNSQSKGQSRAGTRIESRLIADKVDLWWDENTEDLDVGEMQFWNAHVKLSDQLFEEMLTYPIPLDLRALRVLKGSAFALDIYSWLTHRFHSVDKDVEIPWHNLQLQFGAKFEATPDGTRDFKKNFIKHLQNVRTIYPDAKLLCESECLILKKSPTHVKQVTRMAR